ncbi:MAG: hypothetical protein LBI58_01160 [Tannerellaceae bacterium]|jgi:hypothetical protein|nr:hypothetical protein [Tannerellaceae bacterium]
MRTYRKLFLLLVVACMIPAVSLHAANDSFTLGGRDDHKGKPILYIQIFSDGQWQIYRQFDGAYYGQFYSETTILALRIGKTVYSTNWYNSHGALRMASSDISSAAGPDIDVEHITKRYEGAYEGKPFHIDLTVRYDKNDPDNITMTAVIHAGQIAEGTDISLAYGFDSYVNGGDFSVAVTSPDIIRDGKNLNGSNINEDYYLTSEEVQKLSVVGCVNNEGHGSVMAFYTIGGRQFDRAYSARYDSDIHLPETFVAAVDHNVFYYHDWDNAMDIAYDNIPAGQVTTISTGLIFTSHLPAKLDYTFEDNSISPAIYSKHITVPVGAPVSLRLTTDNNHNAKPVNNAGFRINMPSNPTPLMIGDTTFYKMTGDIPARGMHVVSAPVLTDSYGEWIVDHTLIPTSCLRGVMPVIGALPAVLTVTTEAGYAVTAPAVITPGGSMTFTVKLPDGLIAHRDISIALTYTGGPTPFGSTPSTVTIPAGSNSGTFTTTGSVTAKAGDSIKITLSSTDYPPVTIGPDNTVTLSVGIGIADAAAAAK